MRNIFDQYSLPENRVTHALMTALNEDRTLLGRFLRDLVGVTPPCPPQQLKVLEQQYPDELEPVENDLHERGIPDGWIFYENQWCAFIEVKVTAKLLASQIMAHRRSAARQDFGKVTAVAIVARTGASCPPDTVLLKWPDVYAWLRNQPSQPPWAAWAADYLEIAEAQLIEKETLVDGTLTKFAGIPFSTTKPFDYFKGKSVLKQVRAALNERNDLKAELGVVPGPGLGAIKRSVGGDHVWDFLWLWRHKETEAFTEYPHLTLGINRYDASAMVTIPNGTGGDIRKRLTQLGVVEFRELIEQILKRMAPLLRKEPGAVPWFRGAQRRWTSINSRPYLDAHVEFDLRTAVTEGGKQKNQPLWLEAGYGSFANRRGANYELQIGACFPYDRCKNLNDPMAIDLFAGAWLGCKPLIDLLRGA